MPYERTDKESIDAYRSRVHFLSSIIETEEFTDIVIAGDLNADPNRGGNWNSIVDLIDDHNLFSGHASLPADTFTFFSAPHNNTSWLDHVLVSNSQLLGEIEVRHDLSISDHFPLECSLLFSGGILHQSKPPKMGPPYIDWRLFNNSNVVERYHILLDELLIEFDCEAFNCEIENCRNEAHQRSLDLAHEYCIQAMILSASEFEINKLKEDYVVPGWNTHCKAKHSIARNAFLDWKDSNKPRSGPIFEHMKYTRSIFRQALDFCKENEDYIRKMNLLKKFQSRDKTLFWKEVRIIRSDHSQNSEVIDGLREEKDIAKLFKNKFMTIYDDPQSQSQALSFDFEASDSSQSSFFNHDLIRDSIVSLKIGLGPNGLHSNHLKYGSNSLLEFIKILFNSFMSHSYIPPDMLKGVIFPRKKGGASQSKSENYRAITQSSCLFKLFEKCLYPSVSKHLPLHQNQFGYRSHTSTAITSAVLDETIQYYFERNSKVFASFLDMSKAFDKINFNVLFKKLHESSLPKYLYNILFSMYNNQYVCVKYGTEFSSSFKLKNGTRQGGILSPLIFNYYIKEIISTVLDSNIGCRLGVHKMNIISYADDLVVLAPSSSGLNLLLNMVSGLISDNNLTLNPRKCKVLIFSTKNFKLNPGTEFKINGMNVEVVPDYTYLGFIKTTNLSIGPDIVRCMKAFNTQFYSFYRRFKFANLSSKNFLFRSLCMSLYGCEQWWNRSKIKVRPEILCNGLS